MTSRTQARAAVARTRGEAFEIGPVEIDSCRPNEVLVEIHATGICHTDVVVRDGHIPLPTFPAVLGHEGAGIVREVGADVTRVQPGDHVVLAFASCGNCGACQSDMPARCDRFIEENIFGTRSDGSLTLSDNNGAIKGCFFGQSSFATHSLVRERSLVKVDPDIPLAILAPLGCGVITGAGTVLNHLRPAAGSSIAVFGVGAVGLSAIMAAKVAGCDPIIAIDVQPERLALASELGASHTVNAASQTASEVIREITGTGIAHVVETSGSGSAMVEALKARAQGAVLAHVGVSPPGTTISFPIALLKAGPINSVVEGDSNPGTFIPYLIELYREGRFPIDRLIARYDFDQINQAMDDAARGVVIKPVLLMV